MIVYTFGFAKTLLYCQSCVQMELVACWRCERT